MESMYESSPRRPSLFWLGLVFWCCTPTDPLQDEAAGGGSGALEVPASEGRQPNLVILLADDLGWGDVGYHGSEIRTPTIDRLARQGVRLNQFYALQTCTPSRAALLTGRHPMHFGLQAGIVWMDSDYGLPPAVRTLPEALQDAGYRTVLCGKWHLGHAQPDMLPLAQGFEQHYGGYLASAGYFDRRRSGALDWYRDGEPLEESGYTTDLIAREAARVIAEHDSSRPLFLCVSFTAPHRPLEAPQEYLERYAHLGDVNRRTYAAMVECMDDGIARIVAALDERGMRDDTLLIFASDNGAADYVAGSNAPLRGGKKTLYEGGLRVPALAVWPGRIEAGTRCDQLIHIVDWYPTLLGLAGGQLDQDQSLDGRDVWTMLAEGRDAARQELFLNYFAPETGALRLGSWKLVVVTDEAGDTRRVELYNLEEDPGESRDQSHQRAGLLADMLRRLRSHGARALPVRAREKRE